MKELIEIMEKYGINSVRLPQNCGNVILKNNSLEYDYKYALRYYREKTYAYKVAYDFIVSKIEDIVFFKNNVNNVFESTMYHTDFDNKTYNHIVEKFTTYISDIRDSGVQIKNNNVVVGNINQLRKFSSYTNNHYRYCRCGDSYTNEDVKRMLEIGNIFDGLFQPYNSFDEYYHNSIVD